MRLTTIIIILLCCVFTAQAQIDISKTHPGQGSILQSHELPHFKKEIKIKQTGKWRLTGNHYLTGGLLFLAGGAKGFNETLQFNWFGFKSVFPKANPQWFWPSYSFKNKYKDGDPAKGAKFPLSTSLLVMTTDQYHLNNFIHKAAITSAIVIKIGEKKRPLKHYVLDVLYYSACYQAGFASVYYPFKMRN